MIELGLIAGLAITASAGITSVARAQNTAVLVAQAGDENKTVSVLVGQSQIVRPPWPVTRVSVTDPTIADVEALTPEQVLVLGKKPGSTDLVMWSQDEKVWRARLDVAIDVARIKTDLTKLFPGSDLDVASIQNVLVISGQLRRVEDSGSLKAFLEKTGIPYLDKTGVAGVQQVMIRVRVAEVSRTSIRALGVNFFAGGSNFFGGGVIGPDGGGPFNPINLGVTSGSPVHPVNFGFPSGVSVGPATTLFAGINKADMEVFVQALQENQYLRVLAEPSLKCISGEEASFLAGGEFPIPVVQGGGGGATGNTAITIEYREFGIRLKFKPMVLGDSTIRLQVAPEVSQLSDVGAVVIQGLRIPSLETRKAETTLELKSGQTFALAGLLSEHQNGRNSRVPGLGDIPILGQLFRSVRYENGETELVVMVTADLVEPLSEAGKMAVPGSLSTPPDDWELYAKGKLDGDIPAKASDADAVWLEERGLSRLRGPGAWTSYSQPVASGHSTMRQPGEGNSK
jgi:pilus assembly protein CpaC